MKTYTRHRGPVNRRRDLNGLLDGHGVTAYRFEAMGGNRHRIVLQRGQHVLAVSYAGLIEHPKNAVASKLRRAFLELEEAA